MESKDTPETAEDHHSSNDTPKPSDVSNEDHAIEPSIADVSPNLNLEGIELVLQWFSETAKTVAGGPEALKVVQTVILRQAMKHQFLLHGLLALAALHLAHSHSGNDLIAEAKYINVGLPIFSYAVPVFLKNVLQTHISGAIVPSITHYLLLLSKLALKT